MSLPNSMRGLAVLLALLCCCADQCHAQEPGDAGVFADAEGTTTTFHVVPNEIFYLYVVVFELPELFAYEGSLEGIPPGLINVSSSFGGPAPLFLGTDPLNFIVGTGGCVKDIDRFIIAEFGFIATQPIPSDTAILFRGSRPSSFNGVPGYLICDQQTLVPFGVATQGAPDYPDGAVILNPLSDSGPVSATTTSVGAIKSRY